MAFVLRRKQGQEQVRRDSSQMLQPVQFCLHVGFCVRINEEAHYLDTLVLALSIVLSIDNTPKLSKYNFEPVEYSILWRFCPEAAGGTFFTRSGKKVIHFAISNLVRTYNALLSFLVALQAPYSPA